MNRNRLALLVLGAVFSIFLFQKHVLDPSAERLRAELESEEAELRKYERVLAAPVSAEDLQKAKDEMSAIEKRLLHEPSAFLASTKVQTRITDGAAKAGLSLSTLKPVDPVESDGYRIVPVYFEGNGTIRQVSEFLQAMDRDQLLLRVDRISLNIMSLQNPRDLRVKMQVSGVMRR